MAYSVQKCFRRWCYVEGGDGATLNRSNTTAQFWNSPCSRYYGRRSSSPPPYQLLRVQGPHSFFPHSTNCVLIYLFIYVYAPGYHHRNNHRRLRHTTLTTTVTPPEDTPARYQGPQSTALNQIRQRRTPLISKKSLSYVGCPLVLSTIYRVLVRGACVWRGGGGGRNLYPVWVLVRNLYGWRCALPGMKASLGDSTTNGSFDPRT